jgi:hypothetical protein
LHWGGVPGRDQCTEEGDRAGTSALGWGWVKDHCATRMAAAIHLAAAIGLHATLAAGRAAPIAAAGHGRDPFAHTVHLRSSGLAERERIRRAVRA